MTSQITIDTTHARNVAGITITYDDAVRRASSNAAAQKYSRRRLNVPRQDYDVLRWLDLQDDASASVRMLIHDYIENHGMSDPTCRPHQLTVVHAASA